MEFKSDQGNNVQLSSRYTVRACACQTVTNPCKVLQQYSCYTIIHTSCTVDRFVYSLQSLLKNISQTLKHISRC